MEPNFIDEGHCDVFMNENKIRLNGRIQITLSTNFDYFCIIIFL
jgi:hypothetical protein